MVNAWQIVSSRRVAADSSNVAGTPSGAEIINIMTFVQEMGSARITFRIDRAKREIFDLDYEERTPPWRDRARRRCWLSAAVLDRVRQLRAAES
jgi:hypothetical protein